MGTQTQLLMPPPDEILDGSALKACLTRLQSATAILMGNNSVVVVDSQQVDENPTIFQNIFTRSYCSQVVDMLENVAMKITPSNYSPPLSRRQRRQAKVPSNESPSSATVTNLTSFEILEEHGRFLAANVTLENDCDPNDGEFAKGGGGYDTYTNGANSICDPFNPWVGCDSDKYGDLLIGLETAKAAVLVADAALDMTNAAVFPGTSVPTALALAAVNAALAAVEGVVGAVEFTGGEIDGTMVKVTWRNVKRILINMNRVQDNVAIQGDRVTLQIVDKFSITGPGRRRELLNHVDASSETVETSRQLLDASLYLRGYGCDSIDNDNNLIVDECAEDKVPATLRMDYGAACLNHVFLTEEELKACVEQNLVAMDDCHPVQIPVYQGTTGTCSAVHLTYSVETTTCAAENAVTRTFGPFQLDDAAPVLTLLHCPTEPLAPTLEMIDLGPLGINATDDCGLATVAVQVVSDEDTSKSVNAKLYRTGENGTDYGVLLRADSHTKLSCNPLESDCGGACFDGRMYTIVVTATDWGGRTSTASCSVSVDLPAGMTPENCAAKFAPEAYVPQSYTLVDTSTGAMGAVLTSENPAFCRRTEYFRLLALGELGNMSPPKFSGCDGLDNNCDVNQQIDECDEDVWPPTFHLQAARTYVEPAHVWFTNESALLEWARATVQPEDDCGIADFTSVTLTRACDISAVTLVVEDRCSNTAQTVLPVRFDDADPFLTLQLECPTQPLEPTLDLINLGPLGINATDDCGLATVRVQVLSDEDTSKAVNAKLYRTGENGADYGVLLRADALTALSCNPLESDCAGTCFDGRDYTILVTATDVGGHVATATCTVTIDLPEGVTPENCTAKFAPKTYVPQKYTLVDTGGGKITGGTGGEASTDGTSFIANDPAYCRRTEYFRLSVLGQLGDTSPPKYSGCDGLDNNCDVDQQVDECDEDVWPPSFHMDEARTYVEPAQVWFTNESTLLDWVRETVQPEDDCGSAEYTSLTLNRACDLSTVALAIKDRCNNTAEEILPVRFDDTAPVNNFMVLNHYVPKFEAKISEYVDVNMMELSGYVQDTCDPNPLVKLTVFADELEVPPKIKPVLIQRRYNPITGAFTGWRVYILPKTAPKCDGHIALCDEADGRVYTVRLCVTNKANLTTCKERGVLVPTKQMAFALHKSGATFRAADVAKYSQGKLFLLEEDEGFLNTV